MNFLKLYENKKMKLFEKKLVEEKKILDHDNIQSSMKKVKQRKINSELQMLIMRSEEDQNKSRLREKYKKDKERIKSMISEKKSLEEE